MNIFLFDMGLPMIFPSIVLMVIALVPVVIIEACVIASRLQLDVRKVFASVTVANLVSTLLGIPVTWLGLALLQIGSVVVLGTIAKWIPQSNVFSLTLGAPWIAPGHNNEKSIILGAMLFLLIPYGLASWAVEYLVVKAMLVRNKEFSIAATNLKASVGKANLVSYCLLAVFVILFWGGTIYYSRLPS